jgi:hypothetical protein
VPKRKKHVSARLQAARDTHDKFLASLGIDPKKPPVLSGVDLPARHAHERGTSDKVPGNGTKVDRSRDNCGLIIGQPYHKGPLMVLSGKDDLKTNKRRDR